MRKHIKRLVCMAICAISVIASISAMDETSTTAATATTYDACLDKEALHELSTFSDGVISTVEVISDSLLKVTKATGEQLLICSQEGGKVLSIAFRQAGKEIGKAILLPLKGVTSLVTFIFVWKVIFSCIAAVPVAQEALSAFAQLVFSHGWDMAWLAFSALPLEAKALLGIHFGILPMMGAGIAAVISGLGKYIFVTGGLAAWHAIINATGYLATTLPLFI